MIAQDLNLERTSRKCRRTVRLPRGATSAMRLSEGEVIRVAGRSGIVWATMEGDLKDYVIPAGKHAQFAAAGLLVIQGIESENEASLEAERGALS